MLSINRSLLLLRIVGPFAFIKLIPFCGRQGSVRVPSCVTQFRQQGINSKRNIKISTPRTDQIDQIDQIDRDLDQIDQIDQIDDDLRRPSRSSASVLRGWAGSAWYGANPGIMC